MRDSAFRTVLIALVLASGSERAKATVMSQSFDGPQLVWHVLDASPTAKVLSHGVDGDQVRQGSGSERLTIAAASGESVRFAHPVGRLPILDELEVRLWMRTTHPGATIAARVVLPRTIDQRSGMAKSVLVVGDRCASAERWQQLRIADVPDLLAAQVRVLRAARREEIDSREAYVDAIVLVISGGADNTTVWTDGLEVDGIVLADVPMTSGESGVVRTVFSPPARPQSSATRATANSGPAVSSHHVQLRGTTLLLADRPFLSRGVEWNGESFAFLAARGFNTIWLDRLPTPEQSEEAAREKLWFVARPPTPDALATTGLGESLDRVLAWNLGTPQGPQQLDYYRRWANLVRDLDGVAARPILLAPQGDWLPASQTADALVAEHPAADSLNKNDFAEWIQQLSYLARAGTPLWSAIPTQRNTRMCRQTAALLPNATRVPWLCDDAQFESLLTAAATSGCRGFIFQSDASLDAADADSRRRAAMVEQWNDRLELIEAWLTIGNPVGDATSTDGSTTGLVLQAERARLFVPTARILTMSGAKTSAEKLAFVVPGIPVSNEAFLLSPAGLSTLPATRVAGGTRIEVPRDFEGYVLMTEDPAVIARMRQRVARGARRAAQIQYGLAANQSRSLAETTSQLQQFDIETKQLEAAVGAADADLKAASASLTAGNFDAAYRQSCRARRTLGAAAGDLSGKIVDGPTFDSIPVPLEPATWIARAEFARVLSSLHAGENQLVGGDFEELAVVQRAGWEHVEDPIAGVDTDVQLSGVTPREGHHSLQLVSRAASPSNAPQIIARAPVWITSPPLRAMEGEILEISGWVRVPEPIIGNCDGLEIVDSLGGRELALRIRQTDGWQPFRLVRGTKETTTLRLSFALHGLGSASIDGVMVRSLAAPKVKRLPTIAPDPGPLLPNSAARTLFPAPRPR